MEFNKLADGQSIERTTLNLREHNFEPIIVENKEEALTKIIELIPDGASVMNGTSETLRQIGFVNLLKSGEHKWNNLHEMILAEPDLEKQGLLRRQSVLSDFYLGSVHGLSETGELVIASNTGSQLPHSAFTSPHLIFVVGANKITPTLTDAMSRVTEHVVPLEDERMNKVYGFGTTHAKTLILHQENPMLGRKVRVIIVKEHLGF
jgi:L-lactate utilization protein LutC